MSPLVVAVSGCSSSGKTTLTRLVRDIFPGTTIIHEDDFFLREHELPFRAGMRDWDCVEAVNLEKLAKCLAEVKTTGQIPPWVVSIEDQNDVGPCDVRRETVEELKREVLAAGVGEKGPGAVFLLDGFMLFPTKAHDVIGKYFDVRLFLRTSKAVAKARRDNRSGYVTVDGFWQDPPGFFDEIVWPNYAEAHAYLFEEGDVEGRLKGSVARDMGIKVHNPGPLDTTGESDDARHMEECLRWAVGEILEALKHNA